MTDQEAIKHYFQVDLSKPSRDELLLAEYKESKKIYIEYFYKQCQDYVRHSNKENVDVIYYISCLGKMVKDYDDMIRGMEEEE